MDEETNRSTPGNPVRELLRYVAEFPRTRAAVKADPDLKEQPKTPEIDPKFIEREQFWTNQMKAIREEEKKGEITEDQGDHMRGGLVTAKEWLSTHDSLTNLGNRWEFEEQFERAYEHAKRTKEPLVLILADLDGLHDINKGPGLYKDGDRAILALAAAVSVGTRTEDIIARWGGDEFAVICTNATAKQGKIIAQRILDELQVYTLPKGKLVTASLGFGQLDPNQEIDLEEYFKKVNVSLKEAKERGKNQVVEVSV